MPNGAYEVQPITVGQDCFSAAFDYSCDGGTYVGFINKLVGNNLQYHWNFGDSTTDMDTSGIEHPYYYYPEPGSYEITLTVSDGDNTATVMQTVNVGGDCLSATINYFNQPCVGDTMDFYVYYSSSITAVLWNFGDPASGILNTSTDMNPSHHYAEAGQYPVTLIIGNGTETDTIYWQAYVLDCNVWSGDANQDGKVTADDLLPIGIYYGSTGLARTNATTDWEAQAATDWSSVVFDYMYLHRLVDKKHADCNGDGLINEQDVAAINANFGKQHLAHNTNSEMQLPEPNAPTLRLLAPSEPVDAGTILAVPLWLGDVLHPATDIYGYSAIIEYPKDWVNETAVMVDFADSWLGTTGVLTLVKNDAEKGQLHIAAVLTDHQAKDGSGLLATIHLPLRSTANGTLNLRLHPSTKVASNTFNMWGGVGNQQVFLNLYLADAELTVMGSVGITNPKTTVLLYPNPAAQSLFVETGNHSVQRARIINVLGQTVWEQSFADAIHHFSVAVEQFSTGIYHLEIETEAGKAHRTWVKQ